MMQLNYTLRKYKESNKFTTLQGKLNHLKYIVDIKMFAKKEKELKTQIQTIKVYLPIRLGL